MISLKNVSKKYDKKYGVKEINLEVPSNCIFGFIGPNGAGKTTTLNLMTGLIKPDSGFIKINGKEVTCKNNKEIKNIIGYLPDEPFLYNKLTGQQYLSFITEIYLIPKKKAEKRIEKLLKLLELNSARHILIDNYSYGMKKKLAFISVLLHDPDIIILDEPLNGLDPVIAKKIKKLLIDKCKQGKTIFLATHMLNTVEKLCSQIGIINKANIIAVGTLRDLRERAKKKNSDLEEVFVELTRKED